VSVRDRVHDTLNVLAGKSEGNKLLARIRNKFESIIEGDCKEVE
jgi:hypothetical protein